MAHDAGTDVGIDPRARALACVVGGRLHVRCFGWRRSTKGIAAMGIDRDGAAHRLSEEADAGSAAALLDGLEAQLSARMRGRTASCAFRIDRAFLLDPAVLYRSMHLVFPDEAATKLPWATRDTGLDCLMPATVEEYRASISFERLRHRDPGTVRFSARQVVMDHRGRLDDIDPDLLGYIVNSFVIYVYKTIELKEPGGDIVSAETIDFVFRAISRMHEGVVGIRTDKDHLFISVQTCLWHFHVHNGEYPDAARCAENIFNAYRNAIRFDVSHGYNYCLSILVFGIFRLAQGADAVAAAAFDIVIESFRRSVALDTRIASWFAELADSHRAALSALRLLKSLKDGEVMTDMALLEAVKPGLRVRGDDFQDQVAGAIRYFVASGRMEGAATSPASAGAPISSGQSGSP